MTTLSKTTSDLLMRWLEASATIGTYLNVVVDNEVFTEAAAVIGDSEKPVEVEGGMLMKFYCPGRHRPQILTVRPVP